MGSSPPPSSSSSSPSGPKPILDVDFRRGFFELVLKNIGDAPAIEVSTKIGPEITGPDGKTILNKLELFRNVEFFAPWKEFRVLVGSVTSYFASQTQPLRFTAVIAYSDQSGKRYSETIDHDLSIYRDLIYPLDYIREAEERF